MHVVGKGSLVVKELGVNGPFLVLVPEAAADDLALELVDGITQGDLVGGGAVVKHDHAEAFVHTGQGAVICRGGTGEPTLINAATLATEGVIVVWVKSDASAGNTEGAGDPVRGQA